MKVILNYKSFYDAFKLGMVDDGFTPVAKILFHPLFSSHTILDENGIPYEVDAQNASRWGNGQIPIQKEIQDAAGTNDTLTKMMEDWENQYKAYHSLGENGILDSRREQLLMLPNKKEEQKDE